MKDVVLSKALWDCARTSFAPFQEVRRTFVYLCDLRGESALGLTTKDTKGHEGMDFQQY